MATQGWTVLLVDDEPHTHSIYSLALDTLGVRVISAYSGREAVLHAEAETPDVVLLDLMMPGWDGAETARRIREVPGLETIPIVLMSAASEESLEEQVHSGIFTEVLPKPLTIARLRRSVLGHLERRMFV